jgi:hypothetical protein
VDWCQTREEDLGGKSDLEANGNASVDLSAMTVVTTDKGAAMTATDKIDPIPPTRRELSKNAARREAMMTRLPRRYIPRSRVGEYLW